MWDKRDAKFNSSNVLTYNNSNGLCNTRRLFVCLSVCPFVC